MPHLTAPRPWEPLSDAEFAALRPFFANEGSGRPIFDLRARLDAILYICVTGQPWRALPEDFGPAGTAERQFRRWAHKGILGRLLAECALPTRARIFARLEHWICRAFRRGTRVMGLRAIVLARRLGFLSALNAPPWCLPDPDLSDSCMPLLREGAELLLKRPNLRLVRLMQAVHLLCGGKKRLGRHLAPP